MSRFVIEGAEDAAGSYNVIRDTASGEIVGEDGGQPEDQTLTRDWRWVVDALNETNDDWHAVVAVRDATIAGLKARVDELEETLRIARQEVRKP